MELVEIGTLVLQTLTRAGYEAYFVGGMVRDRLLNQEIYDIDITTSATPQDVMQLFNKTIPTGLAHGTVTVVVQAVSVEVTTFRIESTYQDFRRPDDVSFTTSLHDDLKRRDFTVNAIAMDEYQQLIDPFNGQQDLMLKQLKAVGQAKTRFLEDPLRMLRGIRFVSKLGFEMESKTLEDLHTSASYISYISKERVKKELDGIFKGKNKHVALSLLIETQLLTYLGLGSFNQFKMYPLGILTDTIQLFMLVGSVVEDFEGYISSWPFSKKERSLIKAYRQYTVAPLPLPLIRYYEKDEFMTHLSVLSLFLENKQLVWPELIMTTRQELDVTANELLRVTHKKAGPWLSDLLKLIEQQVLLGELVNEKEAIEQFVKGLEVYETNTMD